MARRDLSRTVIEGGRTYYNSDARRASHGDERATTREWLDRVRADEDVAESSAPPPRKQVGRSFYDKLAPAHRWLVAQCGRPWDKVYADLCARFDTRTIAGRHVVHDHMLAWVRRADEWAPRFTRYDLVIDAHGILRKPWWSGRSFENTVGAIDAWAQDRVAVKTSRGWWWFARIRDGMGKVTGYAGRGPLSKGDLRRMARIPDELRNRYVRVLPR